MKFCPTCGKQLQYDSAEICPGCGCRVTNSLKPVGGSGMDRIKIFFLGAIFIMLCVIIFVLLQGSPASPGKSTIVPESSPKVALSRDNSVTTGWETMDDWSEWERAAVWSGIMTGPCTESGPEIVNGHGEYGTSIHLNAGSSGSSIWRNFSDLSGNGWDTLTFMGQLTPTDSPSTKWVKIEVNNRTVFSSDAGKTPPGNGEVFSVTAHFPRSKNVQIKISNGQAPVWGGPPLILKYYYLKLADENRPD